MRLAPTGKGCHTCAMDYLPLNAVWQAGSGFRYGVRMHAPRVRARGRARGSRWGCHTGTLKTAAGVATDTATSLRSEDGGRHAGRRVAAAETGGGDRTGRRRLPHGRWGLSSRNARAASRGRPVWLRSSAASASPWPCAWQPLGLPHWDFENGGGPAASTPQQACAVRMACGRPSAVMPPRNARRQPYRRATTVMPGGNAGGPVVRPTAWTQGVHRKVRCRYGCEAAAEAWSPWQCGVSGIGGSRRDRPACSRAGKLDAGGCVTTPLFSVTVRYSAD